MFYHARVILKPERAKEPERTACEYDMSYQDLLDKIARPFVMKKQFICGGTVSDPPKIQEVRFVETEQSSSDLTPLIEARRRMSGVITFGPPERQIFWDGKNITRTVIDEAAASMKEDAEPKTKELSDRVFVVHGHDRLAVDQTEILLHRFGLTPIILKERPSEGRTVIEKFEAHTNVGCAIVLLTPDDVGGVDMDHLSPRARQNVIWEWGYLVSRLGRRNVICLYKTGVEMPSDLHGLVTIHVSEDIRDKAEEIRRELNAAGYEIR